MLSPSVNVTGTIRVRFYGLNGGNYAMDNIRILANGLSRTTTYSVNTGNELTGLTDYNGAITYTYDAWGRPTAQTRGSNNIEYYYGKDNKLVRTDLLSFCGRKKVGKERPG